MMPNIFERLEAVHDRETFLEFVRGLVEERRADIAHEKRSPSHPFNRTAAGWENTSIEAFLDAALSWAEDSGRMAEPPSWRDFAYFLYAGKAYE